MRTFHSVSGHSSEQSITRYISQPTLSQPWGVSDTISKWLKNLQPQRTHISTLTSASFIQNSNWMTCIVDCNCKFPELTFSTPAVSRATPKLFSSKGYSDDKELSLFFPAFCSRFVDFAVAVSFHSTRTNARVKFDSGVIFLDQSKFFCCA